MSAKIDSSSQVISKPNNDINTQQCIGILNYLTATKHAEKISSTIYTCSLFNATWTIGQKSALDQGRYRTDRKGKRTKYIREGEGGAGGWGIDC